MTIKISNIIIIKEGIGILPVMDVVVLLLVKPDVDEASLLRFSSRIIDFFGDLDTCDIFILRFKLLAFEAASCLRLY